MKGDIKAGISAIAAAVMLAACASKGPASSTQIASADAGAQDQTAAEYQRLIDNASNQRICRRQAVTGTRVDRVVCMTRAEMEEQRRYADEVMRDMRESAVMSRQPNVERPQMPTPPPSSP
jgi:hypothetical protein